jgi:EmrB/QacA subfamily drug resistance transporter
LTEHKSAKHHASSFSPRRRQIAFIIVALAFVMDLLDSTIVNIAIPSIQANLHTGYTAIQWLIAGYLLSFATLLITGGRMGDVFGYKRLFMTGVAGFSLASLLCGMAWSPEVLITARLIQGAMAALMVPQVMSLMQVMYEPKERGGVMGLFGALGGLSATLGPIVGGLLIQWNVAGLDWRPIFLINVPVGIFAFFAAWKVLPNGKSEHPLKLDVKGTILIIAALMLIIFPLVEGRDMNWPWWIFAMMAASLPVLALFAWYEQRKMDLDSSALVVPSLFKLRSFTTGLALNVAFQMMFIGYFLIFTLTLQAGLGYSVIKAALTGIPFAIGIGLSIGVISQKLLPKLGRNVVTLGVVSMAIGLAGEGWLVNHFGTDVQPWHLILPLFVAGFGAGAIMAPIFSVVLTDVDVRHAGSASGVLNAVQQVGGAIGIALIGVVFFGLLTQGADAQTSKVTAQLRTDLTAAQLPVQAQDSIVKSFTTCFHDRTSQKDSSAMPDSCKPASFGSTQLPQQTSQAIGKALEKAGKDANSKNFAQSFVWSLVYEGCLMVLVFGLTFLLPRHIRPESMQ